MTEVVFFLELDREQRAAAVGEKLIQSFMLTAAVYVTFCSITKNGSGANETFDEKKA